MRYFLVSLILNLALLFLPLNSRQIESEKPQETISIKLNLTRDEPSKEMKEYIPPQSAEPLEIPQETPPEPVKFEPEPEEPMPEEPEILEPEPKPEPIEPKKPKEQKKQPPKPKIKKQISPKPVQVVKEEPKFEPVPVPTQILPAEQPSSIPAPAKETNQQSSDGARDASVCKDGVGFKVVREPEAKYPKKALMLRLNGTFKVEVDFKFDGEIKIIAVRGENKIFKDEAVKITKELEIKVLKNISHCIITKPYEFKTEK